MANARLLPWTTEEGKPVRLIGDGPLRDLADEIEETQLGMAERVVAIAAEMLRDDSAPLGEVRYLARQLTMSLLDVLRIAESRGERLDVAEADVASASEELPEEAATPDL
jgi:hypothetical protein